MDQKEPSKLTDQELLDEAKKAKYSPIIYAALIGFLIGIVIYSILNKSVGFLTIIPLYFIFKLFGNSKKPES